MLNNRQIGHREFTEDSVKEVSDILNEWFAQLSTFIEAGDYQTAHELLSDMNDGIDVLHQGLDFLIDLAKRERYSGN